MNQNRRKTDQVETFTPKITRAELYDEILRALVDATLLQAAIVANSAPKDMKEKIDAICRRLLDMKGRIYTP